MINSDQIRDLLNRGGTVIGNDGEKIGKFGQVFLDDETGNPEWVTVHTGLFGMSESFVPLGEATIKGDEVHVPYSKQTVKDAPRIGDAEGHLDRDSEQELFRYYDRSHDRDQRLAERTGGETDGALPSDPDRRDRHDDAEADRELRDAKRERRDAERDLREARHERSDARHEGSDDQRPAGTAVPSTGRVRLRKYVVTENVTKTIPVSHEEVRVERDPVGADDGTEPGDEEVTLYEERLVVEKRRVPVEKVRLGTESTPDDEQIEQHDQERVRKERLDTEGSGTDGPEPGNEQFGKHGDR